MASCLANICALVCALACVKLLRSWSQSRILPPLPPGPRGLPLIGNALDMPAVEQWEASRKLGEAYGEQHIIHLPSLSSASYIANMFSPGPIVHLNILGTPYIFLNSYEAAIDLFEKRGVKHSSRPRTAMIELYVLSPLGVRELHNHVAMKGRIDWLADCRHALRRYAQNIETTTPPFLRPSCCSRLL